MKYVVGVILLSLSLLILAMILIFIAIQIKDTIEIKMENRRMKRSKRELDRFVTNTTLTKLLEDEEEKNPN